MLSIRNQVKEKLALAGALAGIIAIACALLLFISLQTSHVEQQEIEPKLEIDIPFLPYTALSDFILALKSTIPSKESEAFSTPSEEERTLFFAIMQLFLRYEILSPLPELEDLNYDIFQLFDEDYSINYLILLEKQNENFKGQGTYILATSYARNVILHAPHPLFDLDTLTESTQIMQQSQSRALYVSGTHRCSNSEFSPCSGTTTACNDGKSLPFRISDVAHYVDNFFFEAHRATIDLANDGDFVVSISVHGNGDSSIADVMLSDGTTQISDDNSLVNQFRASLIDLGVSAASCNSDLDDNVALCGSTNVQGRLSNFSPDPCYVPSDEPSGYFIHLEQHSNIRNDPDLLIIALNSVIPAQN